MGGRICQFLYCHGPCWSERMLDSIRHWACRRKLIGCLLALKEKNMMRKIVFTLALVLSLAGSATAQGTLGPSPNGAAPVVLPVERADAATAAAHSHTSAATITISPGPAGSLPQSVFIPGIDICTCVYGSGAVR